MVDALLGLMSEPGRLTYSPQLDAEISERGRLGDGLGINALVYRGVSVVNGSFKGISTDVLWPDFTGADLAAAVQAFARRDRRYGGVREDTEGTRGNISRQRG